MFKIKETLEEFKDYTLFKRFGITELFYCEKRIGNEIIVLVNGEINDDGYITFLNVNNEYWQRTTYNDSGNIIYFKDSDSEWYTCNFDNGNLILFENSDSISLKIEYDKFGRPIRGISNVSKYPNWVAQYDKYGKIISFLPNFFPLKKEDRLSGVLKTYIRNENNDWVEMPDTYDEIDFIVYTHVIINMYIKNYLESEKKMNLKRKELLRNFGIKGALSSWEINLYK